MNTQHREVASLPLPDFWFFMPRYKNRIKNQKYTCPVLMTLSMWWYRYSRPFTHTVNWYVYIEGIPAAINDYLNNKNPLLDILDYEDAHVLIAQRPRGTDGGREIRCIFPNFMVFMEMWLWHPRSFIMSWRTWRDNRRIRKEWNRQKEGE